MPIYFGYYRIIYLFHLVFGVVMICALFGNSQLFGNIEPLLEQALSNLIESTSSIEFFVGTHGHFDSIALCVLKKLKVRYPHMEYTVVLAYLNGAQECYHTDFSHSVFPQILESVPLRFAIDKRNRWMIEQAHTVMTYTRYSTGHTAKYKQLAIKKGKNVIELYHP